MIFERWSVPLFLRMAGCFCYWPEEENLAHSHAALHWPLPANASSSVQFPGFRSSWSMHGEESAEDKAASASKSHNQAEKRRRDRINAHLATFRKLIPLSDKMDKAALLGGVIDQVKDLKTKASEATNKALIIPTEIDEVTIDYYNSDDQNSSSRDTKSKEDIFIRASICCEDRPEVFGELIGALKGLRARLVRADIASLGGRIKSILVLSTGNGEEGVCIEALRESLNVVLSRIATSAAASSCRFTSKRQRFFFAPR